MRYYGGTLIETLIIQPSLTVCQPAALILADGQPPYFVAVLPAGDASAVALQQFPETQTSPLTWNVDLPAGTNVWVLLASCVYLCQHTPTDERLGLWTVLCV